MIIDRRKQTTERVVYLDILKRVKDQLEREEQLRTGRFRNGLDSWMQYNEHRVSDKRST